MVDAKSTGLKIEGHVGTWYVIDKQNYNGTDLYLVEHEEYGDEAAHLIVNENCNLILDDVWNGFDDYDYYLESVE